MLQPQCYKSVFQFQVHTCLPVDMVMPLRSGSILNFLNKNIYMLISSMFPVQLCCTVLRHVPTCHFGESFRVRPERMKHPRCLTPSYLPGLIPACIYTKKLLKYAFFLFYTTKTQYSTQFQSVNKINCSKFHDSTNFFGWTANGAGGFDARHKKRPDA